MRLEHGSAKQLKEDIKNIVRKHLDLKTHRLFFFGSRVQGRGDDRSDIDIGIEGPQPVPSIAKAEIEEAIEDLPYLYKIELVDFKTVSHDFYHIAKRTIEPIE